VESTREIRGVLSGGATTAGDGDSQRDRGWWSSSSGVDSGRERRDLCRSSCSVL
jgi:hypothetical protein